MHDLFLQAKTGWDLSTSIAFSFLFPAENFLIIFWVLKHTRMNLEILFMRLHVTFRDTENEVSVRIATQFSIIRRFRGVVISFVCFIVLVRQACARQLLTFLQTLRVSMLVAGENVGIYWFAAATMGCVLLGGGADVDHGWVHDVRPNFRDYTASLTVCVC